VPLQDHDAAFQRAFGAAIRALREKLSISQEELGHRAGLDRTYVSGIERGVRNPTLRIIRLFARELGVRPSALLKKAEGDLGTV
jgi:transcriptional regulator with XRE-family HTH domain